MHLIQAVLGTFLPYCGSQEPNRCSCIMDLMYLFYLPFCMVFVSSDWIHKECSPLFLRNDQTFVWGPEMKKDLKRINDFYSALPDSDKEQGNDFFAKAPPDIGDSIVQQLWSKHLPDVCRMLAAGPPKPSEAFTRWLREQNANFKEFIQPPVARPTSIFVQSRRYDVEAHGTQAKRELVAGPKGLRTS